MPRKSISNCAARRNLKTGSQASYNQPVQTLHVELGASSYPITIGPGLLADRELLERQIAGRDLLIVTNTTVAKLYLAKLTGSFSQRHIAECILPDGEQHKTLQTAGWVLDALVANKMNRDATVLALGGGVVGDIAGFAASCYQRGIGYVQMPTTLLAQVDSSVGGKTGVNHSGGKNLIGAFYQPQAVIADTDALRTLPDRELIIGTRGSDQARRGLGSVVVRVAGEAASAAARAQHRGPDLCHRPVLRDQGDRGCARRARTQLARDFEFWPHLWPRHRGGDCVREISARRGSGVGNDHRCGPVLPSRVDRRGGQGASARPCGAGRIADRGAAHRRGASATI